MSSGGRHPDGAFYDRLGADSPPARGSRGDEKRAMTGTLAFEQTITPVRGCEGSIVIIAIGRDVKDAATRDASCATGSSTRAAPRRRLHADAGSSRAPNISSRNRRRRRAGTGSAAGGAAVSDHVEERLRHAMRGATRVISERGRSMRRFLAEQCARQNGILIAWGR